MNYLFSPSTRGFYPEPMREVYEQAASLPPDTVVVSEEVRNTYNNTPPPGKTLAIVDGLPTWGDIPPPSHEELVAVADAEKQNHIDAANNYMNGRQWPGKAAMGRLSDMDKAQYNTWLDYLDVLEAVDTSTAPDITWPVQPA